MSAMVHAGVGTGESSPGRIATRSLDTTHGTVLYLDDISVSFDGFRALNRLQLAYGVRLANAGNAPPCTRCNRPSLASSRKSLRMVSSDKPSSWLTDLATI